MLISETNALLPNGKEGICGFFSDNNNEMFLRFDKNPDGSKIGVQKGKTYTLQMWLKVNRSGPAVALYKGGQAPVRTVVGGKWVQVSFTFISDGTIPIVRFISGTYYIYQTMLKQGEQITEWTPKEMASAITIMQTQIKQTSDMISLLVEKGSTKAEIKLTPEAILAIADNVTLRGNHIILEGDTVVESDFKLTASNIELGSSTNLSQLSEATYGQLGWSNFTKSTNEYQAIFDTQSNPTASSSPVWEFRNSIPISFDYKSIPQWGDKYKLTMDYSVFLHTTDSVIDVTNDDSLVVFEPCVTYAWSSAHSRPYVPFIKHNDYWLASFREKPDEEVALLPQETLQFYMTLYQKNYISNFECLEVVVSNVYVTKITDGSDIRGEIKSVNYLENDDGRCTQGMLTDYINGKIKTPTFNILSDGSVLIYLTDELGDDRTLLIDRKGISVLVDGGAELPGFDEEDEEYKWQNAERQLIVDYQGNVSGQTVTATDNISSPKAEGFIDNAIHQSRTRAVVSTANNTSTNLTSITLEPGIYSIVFTVQFANNSTGRRIASISTTSGTASNDYRFTQRVAPAPGSTTEINHACLLTVSKTTTYYIIGHQTSGGSLNANATVEAFKLNGV